MPYIKESMKLLLKGTSLCLLFLILFKPIACVEAPDTPASRWTCTCSSADQVSQSIITASNCSASCECGSSTGRSTDNTWTCICNGRLPLIAADSNPNCFTACNCNFGSSFPVKAPRQFISSKATVILLSICIVFALAFVVSVVFFLRRKVKPQSSSFSSVEESSHNGDANWISHSFISLIESKLSLCFPVKSTAGFIKTISILFRRKSGRTHSTIIRFSFTDLEYATKRFSNTNLVGVGASSNVYRGHLEDNRAIAVKRIKTPGDNDAESIFLTEIKLISRLHHCHLVPLIGYCSETVGRETERLLVFEFMPNGNLRECLDASSGKHLNWKTRVAIALGSARGLEYLHEASAPRILHRDVKSTNILLDENWRPKITDLGMAKHLRADGFESSSSSPDRMQGTFGYFAPEYVILGKTSLKSDVFSFGVVILELITGRKPIYISNANREESLVTWAAPRLQNSRKVITELPDPNLEGNFPEEEMQIMAYLAKECLLLDPDNRPNMSEVVQILSTLAPDISKRKTFTLNLFQNISNHSTRDKVDLESNCLQTDIQIDAEEAKKLPAGEWSAKCSIPIDLASSCTMDNNVRDGNVLSSEYLRTMIDLSSSSNTCHFQNAEENVDLTEPRFESFCMNNASGRHADLKYLK